MIQGNDGGANISFDGGTTWSTQSNQPTAEMYRVTVDDQQPYWLYGGQQDNSAVAIPSRTADGLIEGATPECRGQPEFANCLCTRSTKKFFALPTD